MAEQDEKQGVVEAVGVATRGTGRTLGPLIQKAMADAILKANAEGISTEDKNSEELRRRMMEARQAVLDANAIMKAAQP